MTDRVASGVFFGLAAAVTWGIYNVGVEIGRAQGFTSADLTLLRYAGGAATLLPILAVLRRNPFAGLPAWHLAVLTLVAGPCFAMIFTLGYRLTLLSHAVVISPGVSMLVATFLSWRVDGRQLTGQRVAGVVILIIALIVIAADRQGGDGGRSANLWGDLCFVLSGTLWGVFTWLLSRWTLDPLRATGAVAITSTCLFLPVYLFLPRASDIGAGAWVEQFIYQGSLGGALAIVLFAAAARRLGGQSAALFPALVPPTAILLAIPLTGQIPGLVQTVGVVLATVGLTVSLDLWSGLRSQRRRTRGRGTASR